MNFVTSLLVSINYLPNPIKYLAYILLLIVISLFIIRIIKAVIKLIKIFSKSKYRLNKSADLSLEEQKALNIGAINSEQTMFYSNSLKTGDFKSNLKTNLRKYYDITDASTAVGTLDWLLNQGHRVHFDAWKNDDKENILREYAENLDQSSKYLIRESVIKSKDDYKKISIIAWDMGRLVNISRCCYDCGYITENEAWNYINQAYNNSKEIYSDWNEFSKGYLVGRAMWNGFDMTIEGLIDIANDLLTNPESPWVKNKF